MPIPRQQRRCDSRRWIARLSAIALLAFALLWSGRWSMVAAQVQPGPMPELLQRAPNAGLAQVAAPASMPASMPSSMPSATQAPTQALALPRDVSGAYAFDRRSESIEVDIDRGKLSGYISRLGDAETDSDTPLTYFFDHTAVDDDQLQFETKVVHGIWYSFRGTIVRGPGQAREDEGYYVLHGTLLVHHPSDASDKSSEETVEQRSVDYKSLSQ